MRDLSTTQINRQQFEDAQETVDELVALANHPFFENPLIFSDEKEGYDLRYQNLLLVGTAQLQKAKLAIIYKRYAEALRAGQEAEGCFSDLSFDKNSPSVTSAAHIVMKVHLCLGDGDAALA
jgi:hypothetical protein